MPFEAMNILYLQQFPWLRFWAAENEEIQDFYVSRVSNDSVNYSIDRKLSRYFIAPTMHLQNSVH